MAVEKAVLNLLRKYAAAFREARDRGANESDTVMYLVKFFEEVLDYDSLKGEISKELAIKDRYCDIALKIDGTVRILVEGKAAGLKGLVDRNIEQAENYASKAGIRWVALTNGIEWRLYHLSWAENEGITHDLAWQANLIDELETDAEVLWNKLSLLSRSAFVEGLLDEYWERKKALSPGSVVRVLFFEDVLTAIRRELNRNAPARLDIDDVFTAVRDVLSKESLLEAGDITMKKKRKKRRKVTTTDATTGQVVSAEVEVDDDDVSTETCPEQAPTPT
ncbi:MAG: type I restriction enzyme HsdR N-terminal domain-containing protein [Planctomycetaceae bacterium]